MAGEKKDVKTALQGIWDTLKDVAGDLSTLEVLTLSGEMNLLLDSKDKPGGSPEAKSFNLKNRDAILDMIANPTDQTKGKFYVVAYSRIDFDHDTVNFAMQNPTEEDKRLYQLHVDSIKAAQDARAAFINMLAGMFKL